MRLSKRLELVVSFAGRREQGETKTKDEKPRGIADVGTDHGYVPIALALGDPALRIIAMDVRPGPLGRARKHIEEYGLGERIETRLSDGVEKLRGGEADTVIIAGMGGELVIHILEGGRHLWGAVERWILSPQSELCKVRCYLDSQGFAIVDESMVEEDGIYYTVMEVTGPDSPRGKSDREETVRSEEISEQPDKMLEQAGFMYGLRLIEKKDPVLERFLKREERQLAEIIERLESLENPKTAARREELGRRWFLARKALEEIKNMRGEGDI